MKRSVFGISQDFPHDFYLKNRIPFAVFSSPQSQIHSEKRSKPTNIKYQRRYPTPRVSPWLLSLSWIIQPFISSIHKSATARTSPRGFLYLSLSLFFLVSHIHIPIIWSRTTHSLCVAVAVYLHLQLRLFLFLVASCLQPFLSV